MYIQQLQINNFRNYKELLLEPGRQINLLTGDNAQGKTNLLESIYYAALGHSYRTARDDELIRWQEDFFRLKLTVRGERSFVVDISKQLNKKKR